MAQEQTRASIPLWRQRRWQLAIGAGAAVLVAVVVALVAAGGDDEAVPTSTTAEPTTTSTEAPPVAPLTGLPDPTGEVLRRPALIVKIGNNPEARPQAGLDVADVVFEEEVEGRITRFLAVFHSSAPDAVGPVRSVRRVDPDIVWPIRGLFAYSGGVPSAVAAIHEAPVESFDETEAGDAMFLDRSHSTGQRPNILFVDPAKLWERAEDRTPPSPLFTYLSSAEAFVGGEPVSEVTVPVGSSGFNPTWRWDGTRGVWLRAYGDDPHEARSGEQITAGTLVVMFVAGGGSETEVLGEGEAAVLANGRLVRGRWVRPDRERPAELLDEAGNPISIPPGRTWVHLPMAGGALELVGATATG